MSALIKYRMFAHGCDYGSTTLKILRLRLVPLWVVHRMQNASKCPIFFIFKGNSQAADKESFPDIKSGLKCHLNSPKS